MADHRLPYVRGDVNANVKRERTGEGACETVQRSREQCSSVCHAFPPTENSLFVQYRSSKDEESKSSHKVDVRNSDSAII